MDRRHARSRDETILLERRDDELSFTFSFFHVLWDVVCRPLKRTWWNRKEERPRSLRSLNNGLWPRWTFHEFLKKESKIVLLSREQPHERSQWTNLSWRRSPLFTNHERVHQGSRGPNLWRGYILLVPRKEKMDQRRFPPNINPLKDSALFPGRVFYLHISQPLALIIHVFCLEAIELWREMGNKSHVSSGN